MKHLFFGGIHPKYNKEMSTIITAFSTIAPKQVVIPMQQHIGAPCQALVKKGDRVLMGQKIGDNQGLCVPVHASVSGTVKAVEMRPHTNGMMTMSAVIENDHLYELSPDIQPRTQAEVDALTPEDLMGIIREGGIVGMGGATFPTHVKLSSGLGKVDTIIVNAGECEPYITADDRLCQEFAPELISGLKIIMKVFGLNAAHIAIEDNKPEAVKCLKAAIDPASGIVVDVLPAKYPQGAEKQMIYAVTGREVPSGGLPAAVGCAVFNAATTKAIHDAVFLGMPLIKRIVTVSGDICMEPKNLMVPIGTAFEYLMEAVGVSENPYKVISGGPMMGAAQYDLAATTNKGVNAITILGRKSRFYVKEPHCIRCGKCMDACPMHLVPVMMYNAERNSDIEEMKALNMLDCIECGCCAYTCPACIPLVQSFRTGKQKLRDAAPKK